MEAEDGGTILEEGSKAAEEISNWRTSRPIIITGLRDGPRLLLEEYVPVLYDEIMLNLS